MSHDEPWQVFADNGQAIDGKSATREEFAANSSFIMGAAQVWLWRRNGSDIEVMVQKRALTKKTWPGFKDISVAGHIDAGETAIGSAVREAKEELGAEIDPEKLFYIFSLRTPLDDREFDYVFLYEVAIDFDPTFDDGEVESVEWLTIDSFATMVREPDSHKLVDQGRGYFTLLLDQLQRL